MAEISSNPAAFVAALQAGDPIRAAAVASAMLAANVPLGRQWQGVARFAATESEWTIAIEAMRRYVLDDLQAVDRRIALVDILTQAGRVEEVVEILTRIAELVPGDARIRHFLGTALTELGEREAGIDHLRAALRIRPMSGPTWLVLANARRFGHGDPEFSALADAQAAFDRMPIEERVPALYAYGKALDDLGEYDRAFAAFAKGARLAFVDRGYDPVQDRSSALAAIRGAQRDTLAAGEASGSRPIFVTGKPRSGTTLVEQILASHSAVVGGGEINLLGAAARSVLTPDAALQPPVNLAAGTRAAYRDRYLHLFGRRFGAGGRAIDKSLNTSRFATILRQAMPDAPVIWMRRNPTDTAWSSFRTYFSRGLGWSFDLQAMAHHHAVEDALFAHWRDHYGARLMTLDYADLVEQPDASIAAMLAHCGLPAEAGVKQFHTHRRPVQTASVAQVRQPINRSGLDSAAPYRRHLEPYERAYDAARAALRL